VYVCMWVYVGVGVRMCSRVCVCVCVCVCMYACVEVNTEKERMGVRGSGRRNRSGRFRKRDRRGTKGGVKIHVDR
jgi:hypothetical protein